MSSNVFKVNITLKKHIIYTLLECGQPSHILQAVTIHVGGKMLSSCSAYCINRKYQTPIYTKAFTYCVHFS